MNGSLACTGASVKCGCGAGYEERFFALRRTKRVLTADLLNGAELSARLSDEDLLNPIWP